MTSKEKLDKQVFDSIDAMIAAYAAEAVSVAWKHHHTRLDWSESSISALEAILAGQNTEDLEFQTRLWGSYFGEVLRSRFAGDWEMTQYPGASVAVPTLVVHGSRLYPLMKVYRRLTLGEAESLTVFYKMISERIPPIASV
jgi:hypothetical protein